MYKCKSEDGKNEFSAKLIPHHLIEGPCKQCIVRAICDEFCPILEEYFFTKSSIEKAQMANYFTEYKTFRIKIGYAKIFRRNYDFNKKC